MKFSPITIDDYHRLRPFFDRQPYPLCDYALPSVIAWQNDNYRPVAHIDGDILIVAADFSVDTDQRHLILPLAPVENQHPEYLASVARRSGFDQYWFVPACYLETWGVAEVEKWFTVTYEPEYNDYIYRASDLAELRGNRYAKKRNLIRQFTSRYVDAGRVVVEPITSANTDACAEFLELWCEIMACGRDTGSDLACEKIAVLNTLKYIDVFDVHGLAIRVDGDICGFGIGSRLTGDMGLLQFEKAYSDIKGLYQYLDQRCARVLFDGCALINKENDMGIPGLAKAKKSYHPVALIKSYKMVLKTAGDQAVGV